jgi:hypothetical protein
MHNKYSRLTKIHRQQQGTRRPFPHNGDKGEGIIAVATVPIFPSFWGWGWEGVVVGDGLRFPKCPSGVCILVLGFRGSFVFRLPLYNPSGERIVDISWNPSTFAFAIFPSYFPLEFLGQA